MSRKPSPKLPNTLTVIRLILAVIVIVLILFPYDMIGFNFPKYLINGLAVLDVKLAICAVLFVVASITDFLDGHIARKYNYVSNFGKLMDPIADKMLTNSLLIILAGEGFIPTIIPVIIISRDIVVDGVRMLLTEKGEVLPAGKLGKFKTAFLMIGITLKLVGNLPFSLWNLPIADFLIIAATLLSVISGIQYFNGAKKFITK
ncbi:MAG: CDP-diacylglycerol--glycerol-3-phosphate 3-phosphatidyltransferase [Bacilli bacterium]|nr:CDP-diacylglycerol--glycerol-3-phosphate 3-phosphatidyltransferase [Bacilli bacterium]